MDSLRISFLLVVRAFGKNKFFYSMVTLSFALSFGILVFAAFVLENELSVDRFYSGYETIFRAMMNDPITGKKDVVTFNDFGDKVKNAIPEVIDATHIYYPGRLYASKEKSGNEIFREDRFVYASGDFFKVFGFRFLSGGSLDFSLPNRLVITERTAKKYFGQAEATGQTLFIRKTEFLVIGVIADEANSHLSFDFVGSMNTLPKSVFPLDYGGLTYLKIESKAKLSNVVQKLNQHVAEFAPYIKKDQRSDVFELQPLTEAYFYRESSASYLSNILVTRNFQTLRYFWIVSFLVVALAVFNYALLSISKFNAERKSLRIRSIIGESFVDIWLWWLTQAFICVAFGVALTILLLITVVPALNLPSITPWSLTRTFTLIFILKLLGALGMLVFFLGTVPFVFTVGRKQSPREKSSRPFGINLVFQIQLLSAMTLTALAFVVSSQIGMLRNHNPGYQTRNIVELNLDQAATIHAAELKNEMVTLPQVLSASLCSGSPLSGRWHSSLKVRDESVDLSSFYVDADYLKTLGIPLIMGRDFNPVLHSDTSSILVNQAAFKLLELGESLAPRDSISFLKATVVGLVPDFNYDALTKQVGPAIISFRNFQLLQPGEELRILLKCTKTDSATLRVLRNKFNVIAPGSPFEYSILENNFDSLHKEEYDYSGLLRFAAIMSTGICLFGLAGLLAFTYQKRSKEIAIRKVVGATTIGVSMQLVFELLRSASVSAIFAAIFAVLFAQKWLQQFVVRTHTWPMDIVESLCLVLVLVVVTSGYQIIRAAENNPSQTLTLD